MSDTIDLLVRLLHASETRCADARDTIAEMQKALADVKLTLAREREESLRRKNASSPFASSSTP